MLSDKVERIIQRDTVITERINVNNDSYELILRLPSVGEKKANKIIKARMSKKLTPQSLKELLGEKTFSRISSKISY